MSSALTMKPFRPVLLGLAALVVLVALVWVIVSLPGFQTWAVCQALASRPGLGLSVGSVAAGMNDVALENVRIAREGAVLVLPRVEARLPLVAAARGEKVLVSRLVAKGWKLDLSGGPAPRPARADAPPAAGSPTPGQVVAGVFAGIFSLLDLPVDLSLDGVQLEGDVTLPEARGTGRVAITGGGLGDNRTGKFDLLSEFALTDPKVSTVNVRGLITAAMNSPRTFALVTGKFGAAAQGAQFPQGVKLTADVRAERNATGESYLIAVESGPRELLVVRATYPGRARDFDGAWKLNLRDSDVAPFALGATLPAFKAAGEGKFRTDPGFALVRASGRINLAVDRLDVLQPQLSSLGEVTLAADFDLAQEGTTVVVDRLDAAIAGQRPVAAIRALQEFTFNAQTRQLQAADAARGLFELRLDGLPLGWVQPFVPAIAVSGGDVHGELVATARSGGLMLQSKAPLTVKRLSAVKTGKALLREVDVSMAVTADYAPQGWQAAVTDLTLSRPGGVLLTGAAKVGALSGPDQALKATGKISVDLPGWLEQPVLDTPGALQRGRATVDFAASLGATQQIQANVKVDELVADPKLTKETLPVITTDVRADVAANGQITLHAPVLLARGGRNTDLLLAGSILPAKSTTTIDLQVTSSLLVVDDAKVLALALPGETETAATPVAAAASTPARPRSAPWAGLNGSVALALKRVLYSDSFQANNVTGTLRITDGAAKLEGVRAGLGDGGDASLDGAVTFDGAAARPYAVAANLTLSDFDPAPLFRAFAPAQPATIEGKFNVASKVSGRAASLADLPLAAGGEFQLTSKAGVFRGLPVSVTSKLEATSTLAAGIARLGSLANALSGRNGKALETVANHAQAVSELVNAWKAIPFDQLSVEMTRDPARQTELKNFRLISPEIRLSGAGVATHQPGGSPLDDPIAMEFTLRARGRNAELLKFIGALDPQTDDLGYATCTLPLKIGGTLGRPDTGELNNRLANLALGKSGVTDRAADLLNRLRGGAAK